LKLIQHKLLFFLKATFILVVLSLLTYTLTTTQTSHVSSATEAADAQIVLTFAKLSPDLDNVQSEVKTPVEPIKQRDYRAIVLQNFLYTKGSYLANYTDLIVELSDRYGIDPRIVVAMAGAESSYCKINFRPYNCWGYGKNSWRSPEDGIRGYMSLMNAGYYSRGAKTIAGIARIYNPNPEHYTQSVYNHFNQIPRI
jgi:hypothetical protein